MIKTCSSAIESDLYAQRHSSWNHKIRFAPSHWLFCGFWWQKEVAFSKFMPTNCYFWIGWRWDLAELNQKQLMSEECTMCGEHWWWRLAAFVSELFIYTYIYGFQRHHNMIRIIATVGRRICDIPWEYLSCLCMSTSLWMLDMPLVIWVPSDRKIKRWALENISFSAWDSPCKPLSFYDTTTSTNNPLIPQKDIVITFYPVTSSFYPHFWTLLKVWGCFQRLIMRMGEIK